MWVRLLRPSFALVWRLQPLLSQSPPLYWTRKYGWGWGEEGDGEECSPARTSCGVWVSTFQARLSSRSPSSISWKLQFDWNERKTFAKDVEMCVVIRPLASNWLTSSTWMGTHDCILCIFEIVDVCYVYNFNVRTLMINHDDAPTTILSLSLIEMNPVWICWLFYCNPLMVKASL